MLLRVRRAHGAARGGVAGGRMVVGGEETEEEQQKLRDGLDWRCSVHGRQHLTTVNVTRPLFAPTIAPHRLDDVSHRPNNAC